MFNTEKLYREPVKTIQQARKTGELDRLLRNIQANIYAVDMQDYRIFGGRDEFNYDALSEFCMTKTAYYIREAIEQLAIAKAYLNYPDYVYEGAKQLANTSISIEMLKKNNPSVLDFIKRYEDELERAFKRASRQKHLDKKNKV